jgi:hypothetical protein
MRFPSRIHSWYAAGLLLGAACGGGGSTSTPPPPPPPTPANLTIQGGNNQSGAVGQPVATPPSVKVSSASGAAIAGITVTFAVASGGGSVTGATPTTGTDGVATVGSWTLGTGAGTNTLTASITANGVTGNPATFTATGQLTAFNPTSNASIGGTLNYTSVNIPAGVTVTATSDLILNATGAVTIAGTLAGDCKNISVSSDGALTVTGTVNNGCSAGIPGTGAPAITLVGKGGYSFNGAAATVASGNVTITDDPTATDADFAPPASSESSLRSGGQPANVGVPCNVFAYTNSANPASAPDGADGTPTGANGKDASTWTLRCKGGADIVIGTISLTGQHGGKGGKGTHSHPTAAVSRGGNGGKGGTVKIQATGSIALGGGTINTGNGGVGGAAQADGTGNGGTVGASADATGGNGAEPGLFTAKAKNGNINITGALTLNIGSAGRGGDAIANAADGHDAEPCPPALGGPATATGGDGGTTQDKQLIASGAVSGLANITVTGGAAGNGGDATAKGGKGGKGAKACKPGATGGDPTAKGGKGGDANLRNQAGVKIANGGNGGKMEDKDGKGGHGWDDCSAPFEDGGPGGQGGTSRGFNGSAGNGFSLGIYGAAIFTVVSNGGDGGNGLAPGAGGPAGPNSALLINVAATINPVSFTPGNPGAVCNGFTMIVTPPLQTVQQNGSGSVHVVITRTGTFTGAVTVTVKDQNGTVRGTGNIPVGSTTTDVSIAVPTGFTLGTNAWSVTGTGASVPDQQQNVQVNVTAAGSGTAINGQYCGAPTRQALMFWYSDDAGATWNQGVLNSQSFSHTFPGTKAGVALLIDTGGGGRETDVWNFGTAEMQFEMGGLCTSTQGFTGSTVNGQAHGVAVGQHANTYLGNSFANIIGTGSDVAFHWDNVKPGTNDVIGVVQNASNVPLNTYIWRGITVPTASTLMLDYTTAPPSDVRLFTITNGAGGSAFFQNSYWTPTTNALIYNASGLMTGNMYNLPSSIHQSGELYVAEAGVSSSNDFRFLLTYNNAFANQTFNLPNAIAFANSCLSSGSPVRFQVSGTVPASLSSFFSVTAFQGSHTVNIFETNTFNDGSASYVMGIPILPGYPAADGIQAGSSFNLSKTAEGTTGGTAFGGPTDGLVISAAQHFITTSCP